MKKVIYVIIIVIYLVSCNTGNKGNINQYNKVVPRDNIRNILDSFVQVRNDRNLIYELYIDKVTPEEHHLFLYAGKVSLLNHKNKVSQTEISGVKIDIYSGLEHYFKNANDTSSFNDTFKDPLPEGFFWIIKDSCGVVNIYEEDWIHPFYNLPNMLGVPDSILYLPPDIE